MPTALVLTLVAACASPANAPSAATADRRAEPDPKTAPAPTEPVPDPPEVAIDPQLEPLCRELIDEWVNAELRGCALRPGGISIGDVARADLLDVVLFETYNKVVLNPVFVVIRCDKATETRRVTMSSWEPQWPTIGRVTSFAWNDEDREVVVASEHRSIPPEGGESHPSYDVLTRTSHTTTTCLVFRDGTASCSAVSDEF